MSGNRKSDPKNHLNRLSSIVRNFSARKILIVGDLIADQFLYGAISRVSREAPVFILRHEQTETVPGGAANAAANAAALSAQSFLLGVAGDDREGTELTQKLVSADVNTNFLIRAEGFQTITKKRILAGQNHAPRQQVIRIDYEPEGKLSKEIQIEITEKSAQIIPNVDAVVISDYGYGAAGETFIENLRELTKERRIPVFVDSRFGLETFAGAATSATPNEDEIEQLAGKKFSDIAQTEAFCLELCERLGLDSLLVTRGKNGMLLIEKGKSPFYLPAVGSPDPVDVTGAGDTVMAVFALASVCGASPVEAAQIANHAGGIVVMKRGTATVNQTELLHSLATQISNE